MVGNFGQPFSAPSRSFFDTVHFLWFPNRTKTYFVISSGMKEIKARLHQINVLSIDVKISLPYIPPLLNESKPDIILPARNIYQLFTFEPIHWLYLGISKL